MARPQPQSTNVRAAHTRGVLCALDGRNRISMEVASQTSAAHGTSPFAPRCSVQHRAHRVPCLFAVVFDPPHLGPETIAMLKQSNLSVDVLRQIQNHAVKEDVALIMANVLENAGIVPDASKFGLTAKGSICLPGNPKSKEANNVLMRFMILNVLMRFMILILRSWRGWMG